jgi:hypothetical protein
MYAPSVFEAPDAMEGEVMDIGYSSWNAPAAYLYVLGLDTVSLAWEYLRRNTSYQTHWQGSGRSDTSQAQRWGLRHLEDPRHDARVADPLWYPAPSSCMFLARHTEDDAAAPFHFWRIPGDKSLVHDGAGLRLTARHPPAVTRAVLAPELGVDQPYAFCIPAGNQVRARFRALQKFAASTNADPLRRSTLPRARPTRTTLAHMRSLQALDGDRAGASQRDIAMAIFGRRAVQDQWTPDSELRAQTRYLLRRGTGLVRGRYRDLLNGQMS